MALRWQILGYQLVKGLVDNTNIKSDRILNYWTHRKLNSHLKELRVVNMDLCYRYMIQILKWRKRMQVLAYACKYVDNSAREIHGRWQCLANVLGSWKHQKFPSGSIDCLRFFFLSGASTQGAVSTNAVHFCLAHAEPSVFICSQL